MLRFMIAIVSLGFYLVSMAQTKTYDDDKFAFEYPEDMVVQTEGDYQTSMSIRLTRPQSLEIVTLNIAPGGAFPEEIDRAMAKNMKKLKDYGYQFCQDRCITDDLLYERVRYYDYYPDSNVTEMNRLVVVENPNYDIIIILTAPDRKDICQLYHDIVASFRPGDYYPAQMEIERYNVDFLLKEK